MTTEEMIQWIDNADYYTLMDKWRFAEGGDPFFQGEVGVHYQKVMFGLRDRLGAACAAAVSKAIGWDKR